MKISTPRSRGGSALLIVLGMLAFMIASAIAFSAYMRYARLPSSYLRRTSASREMAKAAVARAIDDLDRAIANNPYPGLGTATVDGRKRNYFHHRVFIGTNRLESAFSDTAPVLTVEALGYIPPPLVNEARYYGRLSPTAAWRGFGFDAGRYAYVALDVSDYFDVNRLRANAARNSSSSGRISLGYLMEANHTSAGSGADKWDDTFMKQFRDIDEETFEILHGSKTPLVSLCDFNLALGASGFGNIFSPFVKYIKNHDANAFDSPSSSDLLKMNAMTFVTDSLFPATESSSSSSSSDDDEDWDLADAENQPFKGSDLEQKNVAIQTVWNYGETTKGAKRLAESICTLGRCALWDYLDPDSIPLSLAIPTTERVPMVCGLRTVMQDMKIKVKSEEGTDTEAPALTAGAVWKHKKTVAYTIDADSAFSTGIMGGSVKALVVYPFCRDDGTKESSWKLDGRLSIFFTSDDMKLRTKNVDDAIHFSGFKDMTKAGLDANGVITIPFATDKTVSLKAAQIKEEENAVEEFDAKLSSSASAVAAELKNSPILSVTWEWDQSCIVNKTTGMLEWDPDMEYAKIKTDPASYLTGAHCGMPALTANGTVDTNFSNDNTLLATLKKGLSEGPVIKHLNFAVSLGVKDTSENKYVDLVPASLKDDDDLNSMKNYTFMGPSGNTIMGQPRPVLRLEGQGFTELTLSIENLENLAAQATESEITPTPSTILCGDPRYNHAPENWFSVESTSLDKNTWLDNCGASDRDGDIFMAVSNQGYLQSVYELAFIPRLTDLTSYGSDRMSGNLPTLDDGRTVIGSGFSSARQQAYMWRTYDPLSDDQDAFLEVGFTSAGTGYKVNPYSDSTNVLMAAFANTPLDWTCASTNVTDNGLDYASMKMNEFNSKYAWNEYSSGGAFAYSDLEQIAGNFMDKICSERKSDSSTEKTAGSTLTDFSASNWEKAWNALDWYGDEDKFAGVTLDSKTDTLWASDRRFLYGYWKDCFAAKEQLFLIFARSEPLMMGGGAAGRTPPQLGSRAVALVWRDPTETTAAASGAQSQVGYPHRTRLLFYKPLE